MGRDTLVLVCVAAFGWLTASEVMALEVPSRRPSPERARLEGKRGTRKVLPIPDVNARRCVRLDGDAHGRR